MKLFTVLAILLICFSLPGLSGQTSPSSQENSVAGQFDGPAELPRESVKSSLQDTPAPGKVRMVRAGDDLEEALDQAACGDTLKLQPGATFTGKFIFPAKNCDDAHWIIIRTSAPDSKLPALKSCDFSFSAFPVFSFPALVRVSLGNDCDLPFFLIIARKVRCRESTPSYLSSALLTASSSSCFCHHH